MDGWNQIFFKLLLFLQFFIRFSRNLAHVIYVSYAQNCGMDLRNFDLKSLAKFLKFYVWTVSAAAAVELSRPTGITSLFVIFMFVSWQCSCCCYTAVDTVAANKSHIDNIVAYNVGHFMCRRRSVTIRWSWLIERQTSTKCFVRNQKLEYLIRSPSTRLMFIRLRQDINPLEFRGNYSATSNNMKLVHWPLMGGLLHLVQRGGDWAGLQPAQAPPCCTKCSCPPINGQCTNHRIVV